MENSFSQQLKNFEFQIQSMKDQDLVNTLQKLLDREKRIGDAILLALKEIKARRIYAALGYSSLFEMLTKYFKLSESSAYTRLQALKLMEAIPEIQADLTNGDLSLSNAALVQGFIQRNEKENREPLSLAEKKEIVDSVKNKSAREAKAELAKKDPQLALPPEKEKPLALNYTQLQITVDAETMETLSEVKNLLSHSIPDGNLKDVLKYMLHLTAQTLKKRKGQDSIKENKTSSAEISEAELIKPKSLQCRKKINQAETSANQINMDSVSPSIEYSVGDNKVHPKLAESSTDVQSKDLIKSSGIIFKENSDKNKLNGDNRNASINKNEIKLGKINFNSKRTRFISQNTKRKVFQRSGGCCEFIGNNGKRCQSKHQLEWDHLIPWSKGGDNDENSLRVFCRTHNQFRTKETHGFWYKK